MTALERLREIWDRGPSSHGLDLTEWEEEFVCHMLILEDPLSDARNAKIEQILEKNEFDENGIRVTIRKGNHDH